MGSVYRGFAELAMVMELAGTAPGRPPKLQVTGAFATKEDFSRQFGAKEVDSVKDALLVIVKYGSIGVAKTTVIDAAEHVKYCGTTISTGTSTNPDCTKEKMKVEMRPCNECCNDTLKGFVEVFEPDEKTRCMRGNAIPTHEYSKGA